MNIARTKERASANSDSDAHRTEEQMRQSSSDGRAIRRTSNHAEVAKFWRAALQGVCLGTSPANLADRQICVAGARHALHANPAGLCGAETKGIFCQPREVCAIRIAA